MNPFENLSTSSTTPAAITDQGERIPYSDLHSFSEAFFAPIAHRCLIFALCQNVADSLKGYVACISKGIVPLMLDGNLEKDLLLDLVNLYKPKFLWIPQERQPDVPDFPVVFQSTRYNLVSTGFIESYPLFPDLAFLLTTSGSTGSPKLVRLSYKNLLANAQSIVEYLGITPSERPITAMPMNYSFGLSIINSHLLVGATILLTPLSLMQKEFWQFMKNEAATSFSGIPYTFEILKKLRFFTMDLPSLKTITQAGGKLNIELNREFAEKCKGKGIRFFVMYGQTEATARMSYLPHEQSLEKAGSIGIAIPRGQFSLAGDNNTFITECDREGELVYQGPNVSLGYAERGEDLQLGDTNQGVLFTGDVAKRDSDGFYYIVGRKKRFIKLFGNRVNLDETERLLKALTPDCACAGMDDQMAIYITDPSLTETVSRFISTKTGIHHSAFRVKCIPAIPKNSSGKTIYSNLEA